MNKKVIKMILNYRFKKIRKDNFHKSIILIFLTISSFLLIQCDSDEENFTETGHKEIDRVRQELKDTPTNADNFNERKNLLAIWKRLLLFSGADLNLDSIRHKGHFNYPENKVNEFSQELADEIDYQYQALEDVYKDFLNNDDKHLMEMERSAEDNNGKVYDWPSLRGNHAQTAFIDSPGPMKGELLWKFPSPHSWYSRPAFDNGRVYIGSPGISYEAYCMDAETGEFVWKTVPEEARLMRMGSYGPRAASSVVDAGDQIVFRKMQVNGRREHIVYINKETGEKEKGIVNYEFLNSSSGHASLVGNEKYLVYPQGIQPEVQQYQQLFVDQAEYRKIREDFPFDSLVCKSTETGEQLWRQYIGEYYAEPLLDSAKVYVGNMAGDFRCYNVASGDLVWEVKTGAPINAMAATGNNAVFIGNKSGKVFAFDKQTGNELWSHQLSEVPHAFQIFSPFFVEGDKAFVGSADKNLYSFNAGNGNLNWQITLDDWIRAAPLVMNGNIYAATNSGKIYSIQSQNNDPQIIWEKEVSTHPIFADLTEYNGDIYASTSDYYLVNVNADNGNINWKTSFFESVHDEEGNRILADIVGQPDNQSSVVVVEGTGYFGTQRFLYAVDIESGEELWKYEVRGQVCGAPAVDNGRVFFGQRGGTPNFYCLDAKTGDLVWKKRYGHVWASANFMDQKLYLNTEGGRFLCVSQDDGEVIWEYDTGLKGLSYNTPALYKEFVYFGNEHDYYAFDKNTGELKWTFNIGDGKTDSGTCMVKDDIFYCGGLWGDRFYAVDALEGTLIWDYVIGSCNTPPTTDGNYVVFNTHLKRGDLLTPDHTVCLDAKTGEFQYEHLFGGLSGPAIGNNLVFATSTDGPFIKAWDIASGEMVWSYLMGGRAEESCVTIYGDKAFIIASDGFVYAFE